MDPVSVSWVLYSLRELMGFEDLRQKILEQELHRIPDLVYGKTFSMEYKTSGLVAYLKKIIKLKDKRVLFTAANLPGISEDDLGNTHYQTFIVDNRNRSIILIDPARKPSGSGIYPAFVTIEQVEPFFREQGYTIKHVNTSAACQIKMQDVFCQTWSLYLQILSTIDPEKRINIPQSQEKKYGILLDFFKHVLAYPGFCDMLRKQYFEAITNYSMANQDKARLLQQDPCYILQNMTPLDMFDDEADSNMT
jgi:hypothetical protein